MWKTAYLLHAAAFSRAAARIERIIGSVLACFGLRLILDRT